MSSDPLRASAYPRLWRGIAGCLVAVSRMELLLIAAGLVTIDTPVGLSVLVRALLAGAALPALAAWLIARAWAVHVEVQDSPRLGESEIILQGRGLRITVPHDAIAAVRVWKLPLPGPGFALVMRSGRRWRYGLQAADPTALLEALAQRAGIAAARDATQSPVLRYAHAKHAPAPWRWYHWLVKFVLFPVLPTAVWFYAHQHIAYGALLGQYYLEGLGPYLGTFFISWGLAAIYLLLYASVWRAAAEAAALLAAWLTPRRAGAARRAVEIVCATAYYLGVPVLVLLPFLR